MNINLEDPRLSAYALGEMTAEESREFQSLLEKDTAARDEVEAIRKTAAIIAAQLHAEPAAGISDAARAKVAAASAKNVVTLAKPRAKFSILRVAATLAIIGGIGAVVLLPALSRAGHGSRFSLTKTLSYESGHQKGTSVPAAPAAQEPYPQADLNNPAGRAGYIDAVRSGESAPAPAPPASASAAYQYSTANRTVQDSAMEGELKKAKPTDGSLGTQWYMDPAAPGMPPSGGMGGMGAYGGAMGGRQVYLYDIVQRPQAPGTESYKPIVENEFKLSRNEPLSTFSIDVDTASYANVRRFLNDGQLPPPDAVRIEEMINYFKYDYPEPEADSPFSVTVETSACPWNPSHALALIGLKGRSVPMNERAPLNLVFLIDVSGSMSPDNKLPLLKKAMRLLVDSLGEQDRVGIVTYASNTGVALPSTTGADKPRVLSVIDVLQSGGSTNGAGGIQLAYDMALRNFVQGGVNRIVLATDGDFNVGISDTDTLVNYIQAKAKTGVFLSVLGFGEGNLQDDKLEGLADKGNGNYAYIDSFAEARRVLLDDVAGTMVPIAKDVKIQIEFNPARVGAYRLIGYENRVLAARDFNDDQKDAGEIGSGHTVTALYELVPPDRTDGLGGTDPLKYQQPPSPEQQTEPAQPTSDSPELMTVKLRYKQPDGDTSTKFDVPVLPTEAAPSLNLKFASSVAMFGMLLRGSQFKGAATFDMALALAEEARGNDKTGQRTEFASLIQTARALTGPVHIMPAPAAPGAPGLPPGFQPSER